jgi:hypothetical protein
MCLHARDFTLQVGIRWCKGQFFNQGFKRNIRCFSINRPNPDYKKFRYWKPLSLVNPFRTIFPFCVETHKIHLFLHLAFVSVWTTQIASLETINELWVPWRGGFGSERQNQGSLPCQTRSASRDSPRRAQQTSCYCMIVSLSCSALSNVVSYS